MDPYALRGHIGKGRLKEGVGGGLIDLKFETLEGSQIYVVKILGNFSHSKNEENWIDF